jgi:hypothetical protein
MRDVSLPASVPWLLQGGFVEVGPARNTVLLVGAVFGVVGLVAGFLVGVYRTRTRQLTAEQAEAERSETGERRPGRESASEAEQAASPAVREAGAATDGQSNRPANGSTHTVFGADQTGEADTARSTLRDRPRREPTEIPRAPDVAVTYDGLTDQEPIASGGNADVMRATVASSTGDVPVAVKTPRMSGTLSVEDIDRLLAEAETWDRLDDHDHVVGVVDYGGDPLPWIAMEYMDGGHLGERAGEMDLSQALWTAIAVTEAVRHAHRRGVAHLDLKPENVLFRTVEGAWDVPKVADWGLSKQLLDHSKSVEGMSPQYSAPEQFDGDGAAVDDVTDVYQLGAVCYELFTGQPPFDGSPASVMGAILHDEPTPPSELSDVPPELDDVLLTAMAKERTDRYDSVLYVRDELRSLYGD